MSLALDHMAYREAHARLRPAPLASDAQCQAALQDFASHSLEEQVVVNLADRTDSKYVMPIAMLREFVHSLCGDHSVLEVDGHRIFTYENTYFDTPGWGLYLAHHNGKQNRYKCRFRRYNETDISYLELKLKNNKARTIKNRIPWTGDACLGQLPVSDAIVPRLYNNYRRMSFWNRSCDERLTVDFDLNYRRPGGDASVRLDRIFIAELKREGNAYGSPFARRIKDIGYFPKSISKYCVGVCLTDSGQLKKNRFKKILKLVQDIQSNGDRQR